MANQDRYNLLRQKLVASHIPLTIEAQGEPHRVLLLKEMTVRDLREEVVNKFVQESGKKSDFVLMANQQALPLSRKLSALTADTVVRLVKADKTQKVEEKVALVFDENTKFAITSLPAIIGRSKQADPALAVNVSELPNGLTVSRRHAELSRQGETFIIRNIADNPQDKPIYINEVALASADLPKEVSDGTAIRLGKITLTLQIT